MKRICKCECGGWVYGIEDFGRMFTWCNKCSPVQTFKVTNEYPRRRDEAAPRMQRAKHRRVPAP